MSSLQKSDVGGVLETHLRDLKDILEKNVETEAVIIRDILFKVFPELEAAFNTGNVISPATPGISPLGDITSPGEAAASAIPPPEAMAPDSDDERDEPMSEADLKEYLRSRLPVWSPIDVWEVFKKANVEEYLLRYIVDQMADEMKPTTDDSSFVNMVIRLLFSAGYLADHMIPKPAAAITFPVSVDPSFPAVPNKMLRFLNMLALASENTAKEAGLTFDVETFWRQVRVHFAGSDPVPTAMGKPTAARLVTSARATVAAEKQAATGSGSGVEEGNIADFQQRLMADPGALNVTLSPGAGGAGGAGLSPGRGAVAGVAGPSGTADEGALTQLNLRSRIVSARSALNESVIITGDRFLRQSKRTSTSDVKESGEKKKRKK